MKFKIRFSAWLIGGILATVICIILALTLFILQDETFFPVLFPILTFTIFNLAFRGTIPSVTTQVFVMIFGIGTQLFMYFAIGGVIGLIFQKAKNKYLKLGIVLLGVLVIPGVMAKTHFEEQQWYNKTFHVGLTFQDCDKEQTLPDIANCYGDVYDKFPPSVEACEKMMTGDTDYYRCASYVGEKSGDIDLCKKLSDSEGVDGCVASIPRFSKNDSICNQIQNERSRDYCFYNAGIASNEARYCEKIENNDPSMTSTKADCIFSIAMNNVFDCIEGNEKASCMKNVCSVLNDDKAQSNCYLNIASQLGDKSFCNDIIKLANVQRCHSYIEQYPSDVGRRVIIQMY